MDTCTPGVKHYTKQLKGIQAALAAWSLSAFTPKAALANNDKTAAIGPHDPSSMYSLPYLNAQ